MTTVTEPFKFLIAPDTSASVWPSSELVASSRTNSFGLVNIALAIPSLCFCPPLKLLPFSLTNESN